MTIRREEFLDSLYDRVYTAVEKESAGDFCFLFDYLKSQDWLIVDEHTDFYVNRDVRYMRNPSDSRPVFLIYDDINIYAKALKSFNLPTCLYSLNCTIRKDFDITKPSAVVFRNSIFDRLWRTLIGIVVDTEYKTAVCVCIYIPRHSFAEMLQYSKQNPNYIFGDAIESRYLESKNNKRSISELSAEECERLTANDLDSIYKYTHPDIIPD